jgi:hypothetical protein
MTNYTITVSGAELAIVRRVLGRMTDAKEVKPRAVGKPATFARVFGKPPTLTPKQKQYVETQWRELVAAQAGHPGAWGEVMLESILNARPGYRMGYGTGEQIKAAWGIDA